MKSTKVEKKTNTGKIKAEKTSKSKRKAEKPIEKSIVIAEEDAAKTISTETTKRKGSDKKQSFGKEETYRNSLKPFLDVVRKIKSENLLKKDHNKYLERFPFYDFFNMIYDGIISVKEFTKNSTTIDIIVQKYKKHLKYFQFDDMKIKFSEEDIGNLLGVQTQGQVIKVSGHIKKEEKKDIEYTSFIDRHFKGDTNVNKKKIEEQLFSAIKGTTEQDREDTIKLLLLHLVATFLVSNANSTVSSNLVPYCICNEKMSMISWPKTIHKHLMDQVEKYVEKPRKITACVTLLLWWICEKTYVLKTPKLEYESSYPVAGKWNISQLKPITLLTMKYESDVQGKEIALLKDAINKEKEYEEIFKEREENYKQLIQRLEMDNKRLQSENAQLRRELSKYKEESTSTDSNSRKLICQEISGREDELSEKEIEDSDSDIADKYEVVERKKFDEEEEREDDGEDGEGKEIVQQKVDSEKENDDNVEQKQDEIDGEEKKEEEGKFEENLKKEDEKDGDKIIEQSTEITQSKKRSKSTEELELEIKKKKSKEEKEMQAVDLDEYQSQPRSSELPTETRLNIRKYSIVRRLDEEKIKVLDEFFKHNDLSNSAYFNGDDDIIITGTALGELLIGRYLDAQVIDWYAHKLAKDHSTALYFKVYASTCISTESKTNTAPLVDRIMAKYYTKCEKMFFPIHLDSHFTLLEFIKESRQWLHYDSMKPRTEGPHVKLARKVRNYVTTIIKKIEKKNYIASKLLASADTPQQDSDSVDCGMFVTILMKERSENKAINKDDVQFTQDAITLQRGELGYQILSCKKYSWSIEVHLTQQFLLSEANKQT